MATDYFKKGKDNFDNNRYKEALMNFNTIINTHPQNASFHIYRGLAQQKLNNYKAAYDDYSQAIKIDPKQSTAYYNRGNVHNSMGRSRQALADYNASIKLDPNFSQAYIGRGNVQEQLNNPKEALQDYSTAIKLNNSSTTAYLSRGILLEYFQDYSSAIEDYSIAIQLQPNSTLAYFNRAVVNYSINNLYQALADYNQCIRLDPRDDLVYYNRALTNYSLKKYNQAKEDNSKSIELHSQNHQAYNNRGILNELLKKQKQAMIDYDTAIRISPTESSTYNNRALLKQSQNRFKEAEQDYNSALKILPNHPLYLYNLAFCHLEKEEPTRAISAFDQGTYIFQTQTEVTLKNKYGLTNNNIAQINDIFNKFYDIELQLEQIEEQARMVSNKDAQHRAKKGKIELKGLMIQRLANLQSQRDRPPQKLQDIQNKLITLQQILKSLAKKVGFMKIIVQNVMQQQQKVKREVRKIDKPILGSRQIKDKLDQISFGEMRQFYECLHSFMVNHFLSYFMYFFMFLSESRQTTVEITNILKTIAYSQPITKKMSGFGVLVLTPLQVLESESKQSINKLCSKISQKVAMSYLKNYKIIANYISFTIESLMDNKKFNEVLTKNILQQDKSYLNSVWEKISQNKNSGQSRILKSIFGKFQYKEQIAAAHMTLILKVLLDFDKDLFIHLSANKQNFAELIQNSLPPHFKTAKDQEPSFITSDFKEMGSKENAPCCKKEECLIM